jgi:hypothetical protein
MKMKSFKLYDTDVHGLITRLTANHIKHILKRVEPTKLKVYLFYSYVLSVFFYCISMINSQFFWRATSLLKGTQD